MTLAAVCAILYRRRIAGPVLLGLAIATKIYPAVLLPLLIARIWRGEGRAAALRGLALTVVAALAVYLPFALVAPKGVTRSVWDQLGRPLQIESLGVGRSARAPPRARDAARVGVGLRLAEPDGNRGRGRGDAHDDRRRGRAASRLGALRAG